MERNYYSFVDFVIRIIKSYCFINKTRIKVNKCNIHLRYQHKMSLLSLLLIVLYI